MGSIKSSLGSRFFSFIKRHWETFLLVSFFFGCWGFFYATTGGSSTGDSLLYMDLGLTPRATGEILNRWAHIYLQKLFLDLSPSPLQGSRIFWGFLISSTLILVYLSGKKLRKDSNQYNGLAAALLFGGSFLISKYPGDTLADYTAMFFVTLGVFVYLTFFRISPRYQWILIVLFGYIFFAATKSKESGVILAILFFGFGFTQNQFRIKSFLRNSVFLLIGFGLAFGTLALLDLIFVNNAYASLEAKAFSQYSSFVFKSTSLETGVNNRLTYIFSNLIGAVANFGLPWIKLIFERLSLLSSIYLVTFGILIKDFFTERKRNRSELFVWLMPIAFLPLLIVGAVAAKDRHFFPMHPILAVLAAQFFVAGNKMKIRESLLKVWSVVKQPRVIVSVTVLALYWIYKYTLGAKFQTIYLGFVVTVAEVLIILIAIWVKKWTSLLSASALLLVGVFSSYGILYSNFYPLASGQAVAESTARFLPLAEIAVKFQCSPETRLYVTANVSADNHLLGRATAFNVYFDCYLTNNQFTESSEPNLPADLLVDIPYNFAYITRKEFKDLSPEEQAQLTAVYSVKYIEDGKIVLLSGSHP